MVSPMRYKYDTGAFESVHLLNMQIVRYDGDIKLQFMPEILINQYMLGILIAYEFINNSEKKKQKKQFILNIHYTPKILNLFTLAR